MMCTAPRIPGTQLPMSDSLRVASATFIRDMWTASSYRIGFLLRIGGGLAGILGIYFLSEAFGDDLAAPIARYGGDYFGFAIIGIAVANFMGVGLTGIASRIREGQTMGTIELMLLSPNRLGVLLLSSSLWNLAFAAVTLVLYLLASVPLGADLGEVNLPMAVLSLAVATLAFAGLGLLSGSVVILIKQGNPVSLLVGVVSGLVAGVLYPTTVLPGWLQAVANVLPLTHALELARRSILGGEGIETLWGPFLWLLALTVVFLVAGLWACGAAVRIAQTDGSLSEY